MGVLVESGNILASNTVEATINLSDGAATLACILPPPNVSIINIGADSDIKIVDVISFYSEFSIVTTDGEAALDYTYGKYNLVNYLGAYVIVVDGAGKCAKGWIKAGLTATQVSIVNTFNGATQNWISIDSGFDISSGIVRMAIYGIITNDKIKDKQVIIRDSTGKQAIGYLGNQTSVTTARIFTTKGGSTQNWKVKDTGFDTEEASYSVVIKKTNEPILIESGSVTRNNTRLSLADYTIPFAWLNGVSLSSYSGGDYLLQVFDSANKCVSCYLSTQTSWAAGKIEIASGGVAAGYLCEISATEENHFYTGCAVGEFFMTDGTETFDANNKAYYYYYNPNGSIMATASKGTVLASQLPSGMFSWLRADTIAADNASVIQTWLDSSGNGNHFGNTVAETSPVYYNTGYTAGNLPVVGFVSRFLGNTANGLGDTFHIFMVLAQNPLVDNPAFISEYENGVDGVLELGASTSANPCLSIGDVDSSQCVSALAQTVGFYDVIEYQLISSVWIIYKNGEYYTGNPGTPTRKNQIMIGGAKGGTKHAASIYVSEIIMYKRYLTGDEQTSVRKYLSNKYGIGQWLKKDSGFNVKDTSGYTYKIFNTQ